MPKANSQKPPPPEVLTSAEVAALYKVHAKTVTRWTADGRLPSFRTLGGHLRYRAADVYALLGRQS